MGNDLNVGSCSATRTITSTHHSKLRSNTVHRDAFIIEYSQTARTKENNGQTDIESFDTRRTVFVSIVGLYQTWRQCPSAVLYSALLVLRLKQVWIYHPSRYRAQLSTFVKLHTAETDEFLEMLKWKDSQGLVCWMLDECAKPSTKDTAHIHPIWYHLNDKLQSLFDPITGQKYRGIPLNTNYWTNNHYNSKYDVKSADILGELCCRYACPLLKFSNIREMLYQSNPKSLVPVVSYSTTHQPKWNNPNTDLLDDSNNDGWWISDDYNPQLIQ